MSEYKREITAAVSIALIGTLALAASISYLLPTQPGAPAGGTATSEEARAAIVSSTTAALSSSSYTGGSQALGVTSTTVTAFSIACCVTQTSSGAVVTPAINYTAVVAAALNSSEVQNAIREGNQNVYYYRVWNVGQVSPSNGPQYLVDIFVVANQKVAGNWSTGYDVSYTGRRWVNVTVQFSPPTSSQPGEYSVKSLTTVILADQSISLSFSSAQQRAIEIALGNSTVQRDLAGENYYVYEVSGPIQNGTLAGGYFLVFPQVDGLKAVMVLTNSSVTAVVKASVTSGYYPYPSP